VVEVVGEGDGEGVVAPVVVEPVVVVVGEPVVVVVGEPVVVVVGEPVVVVVGEPVVVVGVGMGDGIPEQLTEMPPPEHEVSQ